MHATYPRRFLLFITWRTLPFFLLLPAALFSQQKVNNCDGTVIKVKVSLAGHGDTAALTANDIIASGRLQPVVKGYQITSFQFGIQDVSKGGFYTQILNEGDTLTGHAIQLIKSTPPGGRLFFDCIQAKNSKGDIYSLMTYTCLIAKPAIKKQP